jgi:hypothetical protein
MNQHTETAEAFTRWLAVSSDALTTLRKEWQADEQQPRIVAEAAHSFIAAATRAASAHRLGLPEDTTLIGLDDQGLFAIHMRYERHTLRWDITLH